MADKVYFNLSEEIEQEIVNSYSTMLDDLTQRLHTLNDSLMDLCSRVKYAPMVRLVNNTIEMFDEDIRQVAQTTFEEWLDGEGCFSAAARRYQSGEEAEGTARALESQLQDVFNDFWANQPMGSAFSIDTARPKAEDADFEELEELYNTCSQDLQETTNSLLRTLEEQSVEDGTYRSLFPAIQCVGNAISTAFEQFGAKVKEGKEVAAQMREEQQQKNEETAFELSTKSSASSEDVAATLAMYGDL